MNRALVAAVLVLGYIAARPYTNNFPAVVVPDEADALGLTKVVKAMSSEDRTALRETYAFLSRVVASDTSAEPVYDTTSAVRRAHRAALQAVWQGVLDNRAGEYPGLREGIERIISEQVGMDDVPMSPALREKISAAFDNLSRAF